MKLSIVVPVYNEEKTVDQLLDELLKVKFPIASEIIVVNDGSIDGTEKILQVYKKKKNIILISYPEDKGKGYALRQGFEEAGGDIIAIQDADLAEVQLQLTKSQILQQTALAMLAQANAAPQSILTLFGG